MFNIFVFPFPSFLISALLISLSIFFFTDAFKEVELIYGADSKDNSSKWVPYSSAKFSLMYPENWKVEEKISKFHVLDLKLLKDNPFSFLGISFSALMDSDKLSNELVLEQSEDFGKFVTKSGYSTFDVLEKNLTKYKIDNNPSASHIVKYVYEENNLGGKLLEIFSIIDKKLFTLTYQSTTQNFDKELPIINRIISSIKILP
jgi:hypothetical protein